MMVIVLLITLLSCPFLDLTKMLILGVVADPEASPIDVKILSPREGFNFSSPFEIRFRITNKLDREIAFRRGGLNRIKLFVQLRYYNWTLWDTGYNGGPELGSGETYERNVTCDLASYKGPVRIVLYYQVRVNGEIVRGFQAVAGYYAGFSPRGDIGLYGLPYFAYSKLIKCLRELGFSVVYVDQKSFKNVRVVILDYDSLLQLQKYGGINIPSEDELKEYVINGGGLWIIDMPCGSELLGVKSSERKFIILVLTKQEAWIKEHEITRGISTIFCFGRYLIVPSGVDELIKLNGKTVLAVQELGLGRIVWTGGWHSFTDWSISEGDNEKLARNIVRWLFKPISYDELKRRYVKLLKNYEALERELLTMCLLILAFLPITIALLTTIIYLTKRIRSLKPR